MIVTTLLDPVLYTKDDLAQLYRQRRCQELDLRSIKTEMKMNVLRCKTPDLVHKEICTHILAYNLIRTIMAQAAVRHHLEPRTISFKGTMQTLDAFQPLIRFQGRRDLTFRVQLYLQILDSIVLHRVADRPNRFEPRAKKRSAPFYRNLFVPRYEAKALILKRVAKI